MVQGDMEVTTLIFMERELADNSELVTVREGSLAGLSNPKKCCSRKLIMGLIKSKMIICMF